MVAEARDLHGGSADLVVSHGQTVFHWVEGGQARGTLQLGSAAWVAERVGVPVVSDLRTRDITRGGQGAPLVSLFDALFVLPGGPRRAALNLGGISNLTVGEPDGSALAWDVGPANALVDARRARADRRRRVDGHGRCAGSPRHRRRGAAGRRC